MTGSQSGIDSGRNFLLRRGFRQKVIRATTKPLGNLVRLVQCRHQNKMNISEGIVRFHDFTQARTVQFGHHPIRYHQVHGFSTKNG